MVVGMARSGITSAKLLCACGANVTVYDAKSAEQIGKALDELSGLPIKKAFGVEPIDYITSNSIDIIVMSPGVPFRTPFIEAAKARGIKVIAEIELGYLAAKAPIIAIGGTNGKTTTTSLCGEIFLAAGESTYVLGNIGLPITHSALQTKESDFIVAEIASLQLESCVDFRPKSGVILNITEDHLDRFGTMEYYIDVKCKMFENQTKDDFAVINDDDPIVSSLADRIGARLLRFSRLHEVDEGAFLENGRIKFRMDGKTQDICAASELKIPGLHNLENALAAVAVSMPMGLPAEAVAKALKSFEGVEHRIQTVREKDGVRYINDSKATNPDSTIKAIEAMDRPTVLILGGSNKNSDYVPVFKAFGEKIKAVVVYGETTDQIIRDANIVGFKDIYICRGSFHDAVLKASELAETEYNAAIKASKLAETGYNVLLSPACASYDMFVNFEERGKEFQNIVKNSI